MPPERGHPSHSCKVCGRSYAKAEHLVRHERTHTGSKPYTCSECQRQFSRQDSLARHAKTHANGGRQGAHNDLTPKTAAAQADTSSISIDTTLPLESTQINEFDGGNVCTAPFLAEDFEPHLEWPDAEGLLQTIVAADFTSWNIPNGSLPFSQADWLLTPGSTGLQDNLALPGEDTSRGGHRAVQDLSQMIRNLPSSVAVDAESFTSVFLDQCFHEFWEKFLPVFPVIHRPTFVFKDCSQPLLLNAIALGSLFLTQKDAHVKGQALWRLAHMAVATSWQTLITHRGPYDARPGIQLVLTAVLGQTYAIFSKDRNLRMTARVFHALGFGWARHCGLLDVDTAAIFNIPAQDDPNKEDKWKRSIAVLIQQRALLAHYALDGQISHFTGLTTSVRHGSNQLPANVPDSAFEAPNADQWMQAMTGISEPVTFMSVLRSLVYDQNGSTALSRIPSLFSHAVIMEGLQCICTEAEETDWMSIGSPSQQSLNDGLYAIYPHLEDRSGGGDALIRWHLLCLERATKVADLCRALCWENKIKQQIYGVSEGSSALQDPNFVSKMLKTGSTRQWISSTRARQALLHAVALQKVLEKIPVDQAHGLALPGAVFATATVYAAFAINGIYTAFVPGIVDWSAALELGNSGDATSDTRRYLQGEPLMSNTSPKKMLYDLNTMQSLLRRLCMHWGVSSEMETIVDKWTSLCH